MAEDDMDIDSVYVLEMVFSIFNKLTKYNKSILPFLLSEKVHC